MLPFRFDPAHERSDIVFMGDIHRLIQRILADFSRCPARPETRIAPGVVGCGTEQDIGLIGRHGKHAVEHLTHGRRDFKAGRVRIRIDLQKPMRQLREDFRQKRRRRFAFQQKAFSRPGELLFHLARPCLSGLCAHKRLNLRPLFPYAGRGGRLTSGIGKIAPKNMVQLMRSGRKISRSKKGDDGFPVRIEVDLRARSLSTEENTSAPVIDAELLAKYVHHTTPIGPVSQGF